MDKLENMLKENIKSKLVIKKYKNNILPKDIAERMCYEMDKKSINMLHSNYLTAPNLFEVDLSLEDYSRAQTWNIDLANELSKIAIKHAKRRNYNLVSPINVTFGKKVSLLKNEFKVEAYLVKSSKNNSISNIRTYNKNIYKKAILEINNRRKYTISSHPVTIGRSINSDIIINDPVISRNHLTIKLHNKEAYAIDLNSKNGTFINGKRIQNSIKIKDNSLINIGNSKIEFYWIEGKIL